MDVPILHVHTHSDKNTVGYAQFMWETMRELANHPDSLKMTVHCLGPSAADRLSKLPNTTTVVVPMDANAPGGSMGHGISVEHALSMTDDGNIHLNVDSDTVVVAKGWDDYVRIQLLDKGVGIIGATFEDIGGFSSGKSTSQTFKGIPYTAWLAMSPAHEWRHLKVRPEKGSDLPVKTEEESKIYNLPVGYSVLRDVGWQIPKYLHDNNITYVGWKHLKGNKGGIVLKGLSEYHEEFHVEDDVPFVVHHRGSLRHAYRGSPLSTSFYNAVDAYLANEQKHGTRWRWEPGAANAETLAKLELTADAARERSDAPQVELKHENVAINVPVSPVTGWLKATLDGKNAWNRYTQPVSNIININFTPDQFCKHLRLEGTVSGIHITVPGAPDKPHHMSIRNLTTGVARICTTGGPKSVDVPAATCWQVLVDIDGVIRMG